MKRLSLYTKEIKKRLKNHFKEGEKMKRILICLLTILLMAVGICFAESGNPTATVWGWNGTSWVRMQVDARDFLMVHTSTDSDVHIYYDGNRAMVIQGNSDGEGATDYGLLTRSGLYGFNGTSWDRLRSNEMRHLDVRTDTNSVVGVYEDGNTADVEQGAVSGKATTLWGLQTQSNLYGYNGTAWDRLLVDAFDNLRVVTDTNSVVQARNYFWNEVTGEWEEGKSDEEGHQIVEVDTDSVVGIYYDGNITETNQGNADNTTATNYGLLANGRLYAFDGTAWDRLRSIGEELIVRTSTSSEIWAVANIEDELNVFITSGVISIIEQIEDDLNVWITSGVITIIEQIEDDLNVWITSGVISAIEDDLNVWVTSGIISIVQQIEDDLNVWVTSGTITTQDERYTGKVSTGTSGKLNVSGNIAVTNYSMEAYSFYSDGGDSEITSTWHAGITYALNGIPVTPQKLSIPVSNPTFQCTLPAATTLYYILHGVQ